MAISVEVQNVVTVVGKTFQVPLSLIRGVDGALYTTGDAFGDRFSIEVPKSGIIQSVRFFDLDDEGVNMEINLFSAPFTATANNAAFAISDDDLKKLEVSVLVDTFRDFGNNQMGVVDNLGISYWAPERKLWGQWVARGGPTIAAGSEPLFSIRILADE